MKAYFPHEYEARNDRKMKVIFKNFGLEGKGLYWDIVEMLYCENGYLPLSDIPIIAYDYRIDEQLIRGLLTLKVNGEQTLFQMDDEKFWLDSVLKRIDVIKKKSEIAKQNISNRWKNHAPREQEEDVKPPRSSKKPTGKAVYKTIPDTKYIKLTEEEYKKSFEKWGERKTQIMIDIMENWLEKGTPKAKQARNNPHWGYFRMDGWVSNEADKELKKSQGAKCNYGI